MTYNFVESRSVDIIIAEEIAFIFLLRRLGFNTIRMRFESTFRKLVNLKQLILEYETISSQFC